MAQDTTKWPSFEAYFDVMLNRVPSTARVAVMSRLRRTLALTPGEALNLVNAPPVTLGHDLHEHQARELESEYMSLGAVVALTEIRREPVAVPPQERDELLFAEKSAEGQIIDWRALPVRGAREGITGRFDPDEQSCGQCATVGSLVTHFERVPTGCPRCGSSLQETRGWIT